MFLRAPSACPPLPTLPIGTIRNLKSTISHIFVPPRLIKNRVELGDKAFAKHNLFVSRGRLFRIGRPRNSQSIDPHCFSTPLGEWDCSSLNFSRKEAFAKHSLFASRQRPAPFQGCALRHHGVPKPTPLEDEWKYSPRQHRTTLITGFSLPLRCFAFALASVSWPRLRLPNGHLPAFPESQDVCSCEI